MSVCVCVCVCVGRVENTLERASLSSTINIVSLWKDILKTVLSDLGRFFSPNIV